MHAELGVSSGAPGLIRGGEVVCCCVCICVCVFLSRRSLQERKKERKIEGRKTGRKEGREEDRKEGRNKGEIGRKSWKTQTVPETNKACRPRFLIAEFQNSEKYESTDVHKLVAQFQNGLMRN